MRTTELMGERAEGGMTSTEEEWTKGPVRRERRHDEMDSAFSGGVLLLSACGKKQMPRRGPEPGGAPATMTISQKVFPTEDVLKLLDLKGGFIMRVAAP